MNQRDYLSNAERQLGIGPTELAARIKTPYATYKAWKSGRNTLPGAAQVAIDLLIAYPDIDD